MHMCIKLEQYVFLTASWLKSQVDKWKQTQLYVNEKGWRGICSGSTTGLPFWALSTVPPPPASPDGSALEALTPGLPLPLHAPPQACAPASPLALCVLFRPWPHAVCGARDLKSLWPRGEKHTLQSHRGQVTYPVKPSGSCQGRTMYLMRFNKGLSKLMPVELLALYLGHR